MLDLKEELFFTIDEKQHDSDLTEKGRKYLNPNDPDAFVIPDLVTALQEIDAQQLPDGEKEKKSSRSSRRSTSGARRSTTSRNCCAPTACSRRTSSTSCRKTRC